MTQNMNYTDTSDLNAIGSDIAKELNNGKIKLPVDQLLFRLTSDDRSLTAQDLFAFSDLTRYDARLVQDHWTDIPVQRRQWVVSTLVESADNELDYHLGRILRIALRDDEPLVKEVAIQGLREELGSDLLAEYMRILRREMEPGVREAIAISLGHYVLSGELDELDASLAIQAEETLLSMLHDEMEALAVRCRALESIAYSGETGIRELIEDGYYSPDEEMRVSSLVAMGRSADIRWRGLVRAELQNPSPLMRAQAARACGELGTQIANQDLLFLLEDEAPVVRDAAIFALGRIGGKDATEALRIIAEEGDEAERQAADDALEEMAFYADSEGAPFFDEALDNEDEWDHEPWDEWLGSDEEDLGIYEE
ncbi:MAG: HEAT repeat domain-containing protein [Chloroflexota bacterium]